MDVEIDDGDPLGAVGRLGVPRSDGCVVEEAEAHRVGDFGMVAGGAGRDKGVANLPAHYFIDGEKRAAGRSQRRLIAARRHRGIWIDRSQTLLWRRDADRFDIVLGMDPGDGRKVGARGEIARQHLVRLALQGALDRAQPVGPLRMALAHLVRQASRVTDDEGSHGITCPA